MFKLTVSEGIGMSELTAESIAVPGNCELDTGRSPVIVLILVTWVGDTCTSADTGNDNGSNYP